MENIIIPKSLVLDECDKHFSVNFELLEGKLILGLCGYAKSGKDTIAEKLVKNYDFNRIAFADNVKKDMNNFFKQSVYEDIVLNQSIYEDIVLKHNRVPINPDPITLQLEDVDFFTEDLFIKQKLRPYIIWYAEKMRVLNGPYFWINKALENNYNKIVISDIRREEELNIFKNSNVFYDRTKMSFLESGYVDLNIPKSPNSHGSLLFLVNQYGLKDNDSLTVRTINKAHEEWLFDDVFMVDSRIPPNGKFRENSINNQVKNIVKKFNIEKSNKILKNQTTIFDNF